MASNIVPMDQTNAIVASFALFYYSLKGADGHVPG